MTVAEARQLAQSDPVPVLFQKVGDATQLARKRVDALIDAYRELDKLKKALGEHDIEIVVDLGPVGNAARAACQTLDAPHTFDRRRET